MSAIKDLVSEFNDTCGESPTEMGDAALGELNDMDAKLIVAEGLAKAVRKWIDGDVRDARREVMVYLSEWELL